MADAPHGEFHWNGVRGLVGATFTFTHGISPGVCQMTIAPQPGPFAMTGTLVCSFGSTVFGFPQCRVDRVDITRDERGGEVWLLTILDRRWRWRECGAISGCYNTRREGGAAVVAGSEKNARQLATLCLNEMREQGYNVQQVPTNQFPEFNADYDLPAAKLAELCDRLGLRIITNLQTGLVQLVRAGVGRSLPVGPIVEGGLTIDPAETPDELAILTAPIRYQGDFALDPWGLEADGRYVPINRLSYTPVVQGQRTWRFCDLDHMTAVNPRFRPLALQSVFRCFRIREPLFLPGVQGGIQSLDRILPLESAQVETQTTAGEREPRPAWLYGRFYRGEDNRRDAVAGIERNLTNRPEGLYYGAFSVDVKRGMVRTSDPVYRLRQGAAVAGFSVEPPDLFLRIACSLRDETTRQFTRYARARPFPGAGGGQRRFRRSIKRDDLVREIYFDWTPPGTLKDNRQAVDREADVYLQGAFAEYQTQDAQSVTYPGFAFIPLDGAIQQVTWFVTAEGFAYTRGSRNREELIVTPSYKERRLYEKIAEVLKRDDLPPRVAAARARRDR